MSIVRLDHWLSLKDVVTIIEIVENVKVWL